MITRKSAHILLFLPLISACTTLHRAPIAPEATNTFQPGARVIVTRYPIPGFSALTPGKAAFGLIGAALVISGGNALIKENQIPDPAIVISEALRKGMVDKYQMKAIPALTTILSDDSIDAITKSHSGSDFVVDVKTINWGYRYMPVNWDSYQVRYVARARLIDVKNSRIVAEDFCARSSKELSEAVSYQKLTENLSQFLRAKLSGYADSCANELAKRMLKVDGPVITDNGTADSTTAAASEQKVKAMTPAPQASIASGAESANAQVPHLKPTGQENFRQFLTKPLPRAFAISDTAYFAAAWGALPKDPSKPIDTKARALQTCREAAGKECVLYMVDYEVVYGK